MPIGTNKDVVQELQEILREWEDNQNQDSLAINDPLLQLIKLCELFERETINFLKQDPDPFDDRHPVTSKPDSALGHILRALFKKDAFVTKLVNPYLKDNYFTSMGITKDSTPLNTAACRLLLDLLHGLDIPQVFRESETTVMRLFSWAEKGPEPLRTYATGLLAAAMDIPDLATSFREQNTILVPIILERLWDLKRQNDPPDLVIPERPFANLKDKKDDVEQRDVKNQSDMSSSHQWRNTKDSACYLYEL